MYNVTYTCENKGQLSLRQILWNVSVNYQGNANIQFTAVNQDKV